MCSVGPLNTLSSLRPVRRLRPVLAGGGLFVLALSTFLAPVYAAGPSFIESKSVRVTYNIPKGNRMYTGDAPFMGSAACSWELPIGTVLVFKDGRPVVCADRGNLGNDGWVDVFVPTDQLGRDLERAYGSRSTVRVYLPPS
jgi:hypothetical protein